MSEHDTHEILDDLKRLGGWVKLLVIISASVAGWMATIEFRQHDSSARHAETARQIEQIKKRTEDDRSILIEMRNDIRWIRESQDSLRAKLGNEHQ